MRVTGKMLDLWLARGLFAMGVLLVVLGSCALLAWPSAFVSAQAEERIAEVALLAGGTALIGAGTKIIQTTKDW